MAYTTINKPQDYFNTKTYTGTGATGNSQTVGFQPDLLWFKNRSTALNHMWFDSVRGVTKYFYGNLNEAEGTTTAALESIDSNGFTVGANNNVNQNTNNIVAWNWLAGGSASSNTDGSITSSVSANTTAGFSIVSYTGNGSNATVGHGLGSTPAMIIYKKRSATGSWIVYHHKNTSAPETDYITLNSTNATQDAATAWNDTAPTSSVFSVGTAGSASSATYIAYCFAEKKGYSKFGSYVGNGNSNGPFVYTGFKPAFLITKRTDSSTSGDWNIVDSVRNPSNVVGKYLYTNSNNAEGTASIYDILSNGFKIRESGAGTNASGSTYIYMAFAEAPIVGSNNVPANAR